MKERKLHENEEKTTELKSEGKTVELKSEEKKRKLN